MTRPFRSSGAALVLLALGALAGCAENPAEPVRGIAEMAKFATPAATMPDFVQASRPAVKGDYMPVGVDAPPRAVKPKTPAGAQATQQELEAAAKANQRETGTAPKP